MKLSELIVRRKIRRILQEDALQSNAPQGTYGYAAVRPAGGPGKLTFTQKATLAVLGALGLRALWGIINYDEKSGKPAGYDGKTAMNAVICGDSQGAGPLGSEVGKILSAKGYKVSNASVAGANPAKVLDQVRANAENSILVVAIFGGNTTDIEAPARATVEMYKFCESKGTVFIAIGSPPVTRITDYPSFAASFPDRAAAARGDKDYWLNLKPADSYSPAGRKALTDKMQEAKGPNGEDIKVYGIASNWTAGGDYPDQPDGLHCEKGAAEVARAAMSALDIDGITSGIRTQLKKSRTFNPEDIGMAGKPGEIKIYSELDFERYKKGISLIESGSPEGDYTIENGPAKGRYQFYASHSTFLLMQLLRENVRKYSIEATNYPTLNSLDRRNANAQSDSEEGKALWAAFLKDPALQDGLFKHFTDLNSSLAVREYTQSRNDQNDLAALDVAQILALIHFNGPGGPAGVKQDGINSSPPANPGFVNAPYSVYIKKFNTGYGYGA